MSFHAQVETYLIPAQLALAMLGMGATLRPRDFAAVVRDPRGLAIGLALQLILVPVIALALSKVFGMEESWTVGLILVAVVPGGAFSNLLTYLGRGNTALSISVTVVSTALCIATVPLLLRLFAGAQLPADFSFPALRIVIEIFAYLLVPLVLGMLAYKHYHSASAAISRWSIRLSVLLIGVITVSALASGRIKVPEYGWIPPLRIVTFAICLSVVIPHVSRLLGRYDDDTVALGIEVIVRNVGVALLMVRFFFPGTAKNSHVLYTCLFYAGLSSFFSIPMLLLHRYGYSPVLLRRAKRRPGSEGAGKT